MITKRQFCISLIEEYLSRNNMKDTKWQYISEGEITKSSTVTVAMEYLDLIKTEDGKFYAQSRGGVFRLCVEEESILTIREMIELLPETIEEWQNEKK